MADPANLYMPQLQELQQSISAPQNLGLAQLNSWRSADPDRSPAASNRSRAQSVCKSEMVSSAPGRSQQLYCRDPAASVSCVVCATAQHTALGCPSTAGSLL